MERGVAANYRAKHDIGAGLALAVSDLIPRVDRGDLSLDLAFPPFEMLPAPTTAGAMPGRSKAGNQQTPRPSPAFQTYHRCGTVFPVFDILCAYFYHRLS
jgi:hypothetical protein